MDKISCGAGSESFAKCCEPYRMTTHGVECKTCGIEITNEQWEMIQEMFDAVKEIKYGKDC